MPPGGVTHSHEPPTSTRPADGRVRCRPRAPPCRLGAVEKPRRPARGFSIEGAPARHPTQRTQSVLRTPFSGRRLLAPGVPRFSLERRLRQHHVRGPAADRLPAVCARSPPRPQAGACTPARLGGLDPASSSMLIAPVPVESSRAATGAARGPHDAAVGGFGVPSPPIAPPGVRDLNDASLSVRSDRRFGLARVPGPVTMLCPPRRAGHLGRVEVLASRAVTFGRLAPHRLARPKVGRGRSTVR